MANLIETLFGLAILSAVAAGGLTLQKNRVWSKRLVLAALALLVAAGALELYARSIG